VAHTRFYKTTLLLGIANAAVAGINLVKQKIIAHYLGPEGMGLVGLANSYLFLLFTISSLTIFSAVTKYLSEFRSKQRQEDIERLWETAWIVGFGFSLISGLMVYISGYVITDWGVESGLSSYLILALSLSLPAYAGVNLYWAGYKGHQQFAKLAYSQITGAALSVPLTFWLVATRGSMGLLMSIYLNLCLSWFTAWLFYRGGDLEVPARWSLHFDRPMADLLMRFSGIVLVTNLMVYGVQLLIRFQVVKILGLGDNGLIQAALYFSVYYLVIQESLSSYLLPKLSDHQDNQITNDELGRAFRVSGIMNINFSIIILLFLGSIVKLLLTRDFLSVQPFIGLIFLGEVFRVWTWIMGITFLAKGELKINFWITIIYVILYGGLIYGGIISLNLLGFGLGYLFVHLIVFIITCCSLNRVTGFQLSVANLYMILFGMILFGVMEYLQVFPIYGKLSVITLMTIASWYTLQPAEKELIMNKLGLLKNSSDKG
jgi:O-antigen/teichoic acid export membrane protein